LNCANKQESPVALVTGSARRIGAAIVKKLHDAGYRVIIHCHHSLNEAQSLAGLLNQQRENSALVIQLDLALANAAKQLVTQGLDWCGRLDLLVNNASVFIRSEGDPVNTELWEMQFRLNVQVPYLLSMAARPALQAQQGIIINITDIHAEKPIKGYAVYCQTKAALAMQTKALAREFAPEIRVNAVAPGAIAWPEQANELGEIDKQKIIKQTPLKRHGHPDFIAQAVLALVENPFITGQIVTVDGGRSLV
jgi:pteridine reductase